MPDLHSDRSDASVYLRNQLWRIDFELFKSYSLGRASQIAMRSRPQSQHPLLDFTYGETQWASMRRILQLTCAHADSRLLELGSGTGRLSLFASKCLGLAAQGVELVAPFVTRGNQIARHLHLDRCHFDVGDLFSQSWAEASILYVVATAFSEASMCELSQKCMELAPDARIVVTTHRPDCAALTMESTEVLDFSWGPTAVFVMRR